MKPAIPCEKVFLKYAVSTESTVGIHFSDIRNEWGFPDNDVGCISGKRSDAMCFLLRITGCRIVVISGICKIYSEVFFLFYHMLL